MQLSPSSRPLPHIVPRLSDARIDEELLGRVRQARRELDRQRGLLDEPDAVRVLP